MTYTKEELDALWQANLERKEEIVKKYRQEHPEILRGYRGSIDTPEMRAVREEEKRLYCFAVDNRKKTVDNAMALMAEGAQNTKQIDKVLELVLGKAAVKTLNTQDLPWPAYQKLLELVIAAMTDEDPEQVSARFQKEEPAAAQ